MTRYVASIILGSPFYNKVGSLPRHFRHAILTIWRNERVEKFVRCCVTIITLPLFLFIQISILAGPPVEAGGNNWGVKFLLLNEYVLTENEKGTGDSSGEYESQSIDYYLWK